MKVVNDEVYHFFMGSASDGTCFCFYVKRNVEYFYGYKTLVYSTFHGFNNVGVKRFFWKDEILK